MIRLSPARRQHRTGEWTDAKAVTFIVTLAARASVTLAARAAGMSRKSAYALKDRDLLFAAAWRAALAARSAQGDKVDEVDTPARPCSQGDSTPRPVPARKSRSRRDAEAARDWFFARIAAGLPWPPEALPLCGGE
jgi:hypothetical protein